MAYKNRIIYIASELKQNFKIMLLSGMMAVVNMVQPIDTLATTYNFEVENTHTYYVGTEGMLVHNAYSPATVQSILATLTLSNAGKWTNFVDRVVSMNVPIAQRTRLYEEIAKITNRDDLIKLLDDFEAAPLAAFRQAITTQPELIRGWRMLRQAGRTSFLVDTEILRKLSNLIEDNNFLGIGQHWSESDFVNMLINHGTHGRSGISIIDDFGVTNIISDATLSLDRLLNILDRVKSNYKPGIEGVLTSLKNTSRNYIGAEFVLRYVEDIQVWNKITGFEVSVQGGGRVIDILQNVKPFRTELKSWKTFEDIYKPRTLQEFVRDLEGINALDEMRWFFDKKGSFVGATGQSYLKNKILEMLQSAEGREALRELGSNKAMQLFPHDELMDANNFVDRIIFNFNNDTIFNQIFK